MRTLCARIAAAVLIPAAILGCRKAAPPRPAAVDPDTGAPPGGAASQRTAPETDDTAAVTEETYLWLDSLDLEVLAPPDATVRHVDEERVSFSHGGCGAGVTADSVESDPEAFVAASSSFQNATRANSTHRGWELQTIERGPGPDPSPRTRVAIFTRIGTTLELLRLSGVDPAASGRTRARDRGRSRAQSVHALALSLAQPAPIPARPARLPATAIVLH